MALRVSVITLVFTRTGGSIQPIREVGLGGEGGKGATKENSNTNETRNKTQTANANMATMLEKLTQIQMDILTAQQHRLSKRLSLQKEKLDKIGGGGLGAVVNIHGVGSGRIINAPDKDFLNRRKRSMMATGLKHQLYYSDGSLNDIEAVVISIIDIIGRIRSEAVVEPYLRVATHAYRLVEKSLLISILQRTVDAAKSDEGGVDGPGHFARTLRALVNAGITRVIGQWVSDLVRGPKEFSATEFLKNLLSVSIDLPVTFMALKMSKASRTLISAAKNWEDEEVKRLGKRLKAKWHSRLKNDQSEEEAQALSDRMDRHLQKQQNSNGGGQKLISSPQVDTNDTIVGSIITKIDHNNEPSLEVKVASMETLSGEGSGGEEGEEDVYLKPVLPPAKRPQPILVAPQARPAKRVMKMKVLTDDDLTEGSSTAADTSGPSIVTSADSHALHDTRQQPQPDGSTDSFMPDANLHDIPSDGKGEDKARTTIGGGLQEDDRMKDDDIGGEGSSVVDEIPYVSTDTPLLQLPEGEGDDSLSSSAMPKVLTPVKSVVQSVVPVEDVKPKSVEIPPPLPSAPSEVATNSPPQPAVVGFGKGLGRSIDSERQSTVLPPPSPLQGSSADGVTTQAPKLYALSCSSMKGSRGFDRVGSVMLEP